MKKRGRPPDLQPKKGALHKRAQRLQKRILSGTSQSALWPEKIVNDMWRRYPHHMAEMFKWAEDNFLKIREQEERIRRDAEEQIKRIRRDADEKIARLWEADRAEMRAAVTITAYPAAAFQVDKFEK